MKSFVDLVKFPQPFDSSDKPTHVTRFAFPATLFAAPVVALIITAIGLTTPAQAQPLSAANRAFVDATVTDAMKDGKKPGVSIMVSGPAGTYSKAYGVSNRAGIPLKVTDHFRIGSITKVFTSIAVLRYVDRGVINLNDKVSKYVPGMPNGNLITVQHLLQMRSGLYDYTDDPLFQIPFALYPQMPFSPQNALNITKRKPVLFAPGTKYKYTNTNYILLGLILEKVSGKPASTVITNEIMRPLGMTETSFPTTAAMPANSSRGYGPNPIFPRFFKDYTAVNPYIVWTAGAVISTHADLAKFSNALRTGVLLKPATQQKRQFFCAMPYSGANGMPTTAGYGLGNLSLGKWQGHNGSLPGFGSVMFYNPQTGAIITGMTNTWRDDFGIFTKIFPKVANQLYPGSLVAPQYPAC